MTSRAALIVRLQRLERRARPLGPRATFFHAVYRDTASSPVTGAHSPRGRVERAANEPERDFIARASNALGPGMVFACYG